MEHISEQLKQILRRLHRVPMFTFVILLTLAVAVGANTAVFTVLECILFKPLPYPRSEQLVGVWHTAQGFHNAELNMAPSNYFIYREQNRTFEDLGLYQHDAVSVTGVAEPEQVGALAATDGLLPILGIRPILGRWFTGLDTTPGSPDVVILGYGYWQRKFGGDRAVLGRMIAINAKPREIVGVMPEGFRFLDWQDPALILPLQFDRNKTTLGQYNYGGIARLRPGVKLAEANADVARMLPTVWTNFPSRPGTSVNLLLQAHVTANVRPLTQDVVGDVGKFLWALMGSIVVVLLIACANVANLMLVRAEGRYQELAVRAALGASRARIAGELLFESVVLAFAGSAFGLALAFGALRLLAAIAPAGLPRLQDIRIDVSVLLFTVAVSLLASLLFGSIPILKYSRPRLGSGLREGGRLVSESRERHRVRNALVVIQIALALVPLISSGLMIRSFRALTEVEPGFVGPAEVQTFRVTITPEEIPDPEKVTRMQEAILRRIAAVPGVVCAAFANAVPMDGSRWTDPVYTQDRTYSPGELPFRRLKFVAPGFFQTLGIRFVAGRDFTWPDLYQRIPVAIVSENFAREYWHDPDSALGKLIRVTSNDDWRQIIGVVADVHDDGMNQDAPKTAYWPTFLKNFESGPVYIHRDVAFVLRSPLAGSESLMREVRQAVWSVDSNLPVADTRTLDSFYDRSMARTTFTLVMLAIAAAMALLLGTVGLYGAIAYSISQRTREIGIRIAVGARRNQLIGMFVRRGLLLAAMGIACGLVLAIIAMRSMAALFFRVRPVDPLTYIMISLGLLWMAVLASYIPSRRTATIDPIQALRAE